MKCQMPLPKLGCNAAARFRVPNWNLKYSVLPQPLCDVPTTAMSFALWLKKTS
jgi:hypothetical protein